MQHRVAVLAGTMLSAALFTPLAFAQTPAPPPPGCVTQNMAVPLGLVARLEDIPREKIEMSCGSPVTQYRGKLGRQIGRASCRERVCWIV